MKKSLLILSILSSGLCFAGGGQYRVHFTDHPSVRLVDEFGELLPGLTGVPGVMGSSLGVGGSLAGAAQAVIDTQALSEKCAPEAVAIIPARTKRDREEDTVVSVEEVAIQNAKRNRAVRELAISYVGISRHTPLGDISPELAARVLYSVKRKLRAGIFPIG